MTNKNKKLFELNYNEIWYNDYKCELKQFINKSGNLFITSKRLFFYSENIFKKTEIFIEIKKIKFIEKNDDILKIILLDNNFYEFKNFKNIDHLYKIINSLFEKINGRRNELYFEEKNNHSETKEEINTNQNVKFFYNKKNKIRSFRKISNSSEENYDYKVIKNEESDECLRATFNFGIETFYNIYIKDNGIYPYTEYLKTQNSKLISVWFWVKDNENKNTFKRSIEYEKEENRIPFNNLINFKHDETLFKSKKYLIYKVKISTNKPYGESYYENIIWKVKEIKKNKIIVSISTNVIFNQSLKNKLEIKEESFNYIQNELISIIEKSIPLIPKNLFKSKKFCTESFISRNNDLTEEFYILNENIFNIKSNNTKSNKIIKFIKILFFKSNFEKLNLEKKILFLYKVFIILIFFILFFTFFFIFLIK